MQTKEVKMDGIAKLRKHVKKLNEVKTDLLILEYKLNKAADTIHKNSIEIRCPHCRRIIYVEPYFPKNEHMSVVCTWEKCKKSFWVGGLFIASKNTEMVQRKIETMRDFITYKWD